MAIQLFHLKTTVDPTDCVWDVVTCSTPSSKQDHFLCGPRHPTLEMYESILDDLGRIVVKEGRMQTKSYILPFVGPTSHEGKPIGSFAKLYIGESQMARAKKEYDAMTYLGNQPVTFFNMITSQNYPSPRFLFDRLLLLPLILSPSEIKAFCAEKETFYRVHYNVAIDLSFANPCGRRAPIAVTNRIRVVEEYKKLAMDLLIRRQLDVCRYIHGDAVDANIMVEDTRNLVHRLTGQWPEGTRAVGLNFKDPASSDSLLLCTEHWPILIDYDTVCFPSPNYFQNLEDMFSETPYILKMYQQYDMMKDYLEILSRHIIPLLRKAIIQTVSGRLRKCCVTYLKEHEMIEPFLRTDDQFPSVEWDAPPRGARSFHELHLHAHDLTPVEQALMDKYLLRMSAYMIGALRVFNRMVEEQAISITDIHLKAQELKDMFQSPAIVYPSDLHVVDIRVS